jgi:hypothetical protein
MGKNTNATGVRSKSLNAGDCLGQLFRSGDQTREILQINLDTVDSGVLRKCVCGFSHTGRADGNCKECKSHRDWQTNMRVMKVIIDELTKPKAPSAIECVEGSSAPSPQRTISVQNRRRRQMLPDMRRRHPEKAAEANLRLKEQMLSDPNPLSIDIKNSRGVDSTNPTVVPV